MARFKCLSVLLIAHLIFLCLSACSTLARSGTTISEVGVTFRIKYQGAKKITIAGSFNQWNTEKDALSDHDADGIWSITILLPRGRYEYLFLIDGQKWLPDPSVSSMDDGFGGRNSVIYISRTGNFSVCNFSLPISSYV